MLHPQSTTLSFRRPTANNRHHYLAQSFVFVGQGPILSPHGSKTDSRNFVPGASFGGGREMHPRRYPERMPCLAAVPSGAMKRNSRPIRSRQSGPWKRCSRPCGGACQGSCRLSHAMLRFSVEGSRATLIAVSRSGFKVTTAIGEQLRVGPDQRRGCLSLASWYRA